MIGKPLERRKNIEMRKFVDTTTIALNKPPVHYNGKIVHVNEEEIRHLSRIAVIKNDPALFRELVTAAVWLSENVQ
jgi:hypothetical protein